VEGNLEKMKEVGMEMVLILSLSFGIRFQRSEKSPSVSKLAGSCGKNNNSRGTSNWKSHFPTELESVAEMEVEGEPPTIRFGRREMFTSASSFGFR
jgi:hypothetical protein